MFKKKSHSLLVSLFSIALVVLFLSNCSKDDETPADNNAPIECSNAFTFTALTGDTVRFNASQSVSGIKYAWTFGDGGTDSIQNPKHHYSANGSFQACLTVTIYDISGTALCTSSKCSTVTIGPVVTGDTIPPVITLSGNSTITLSLNTASWVDPGATAVDNVNGAVSVTSNYSSTNPNLNLVGTYTITYSASDAAGNIRLATRTITVKNDAENFAGVYSVNEDCMGLIFTYSQTITVDSVVNNRIHFSKFADYLNNTNIYANKLGNGHLEIPQQTGFNIGTGTGTCSVLDHQFTSVSFNAIANGFVLVYTDIVTTAPCNDNITCAATYTK